MPRASHAQRHCSRCWRWCKALASLLFSRRTTSTRRIITSRRSLEQMKMVLAAVLEQVWPGKGRTYLERMWADALPTGRTTRRAPTPGPALPSLKHLTLRLACGLLEVSPWESDGMPVAWALPLLGNAW
mmetsp:Transcript_85854/g.199571  ORF Transcript_85854/g.199571 Transcript_85854/m.199571 type:complete len:129 (+) Transcript_85854:766-1152(+)